MLSDPPFFLFSATIAHACCECNAVLTASDGILLEGVCIGGSSLTFRTLLDLHNSPHFRNTLPGSQCATTNSIVSIFEKTHFYTFIFFLPHI